MNILNFLHFVGTKQVSQWLNELRDTSPLHLEGEDGTCTETDVTNPHSSESPPPHLNLSVICETLLFPELVCDT